MKIGFGFDHYLYFKVIQYGSLSKNVEGIFWECLFQIGKWFSNSSQFHPVIDHKSTVSAVRSSHYGLTSSAQMGLLFLDLLTNCKFCRNIPHLHNAPELVLGLILVLMFFEGNHFWRLSVALSFCCCRKIF